MEQEIPAGAAIGAEMVSRQKQRWLGSVITFIRTLSFGHPQAQSRLGGIGLAMALVWLSLVPGIAQAESSSEHVPELDADHHSASPHHVSILLAGTHIDEGEKTALTAGIDYEYRASKLLGLGFVAEQAFGDIDATTLLAVADIHVKEGFVIQVGPGIEFVHGTQYAVARVGALYEFELGDQYTISPQFHYDATEHKDAIVFGFAIGRHF
jgi:hypothetical protein